MKGYGFLLLISGALMYWYTDFISAKIANPDDMFLFVFFSLAFLALGSFILVISFVQGAWSYRKSKIILKKSLKSQKQKSVNFESAKISNSDTNLEVNKSNRVQNNLNQAFSLCPYCGSMIGSNSRCCGYCGSNF